MICELQGSVFNKSIMIKILSKRVIWFHVGMLVELCRLEHEEASITAAAQDEHDHLSAP